MADKAIHWMRTQKAVNPDKPFFAYYTPGTAHAPHHAPQEWLDKFKGKFDHGWDRQREMTYAKQKEIGVIPPDAVLNPTPADYRRWDDLSPDMKRVCARQMECYAAALSHCDFQVGRVVDAIDEMGELDNTLIIYIQGDNGSSAEDPSGRGMTSEIVTLGNGIDDRDDFMVQNIDQFGGMWMQNHFSHGWAHAMNSPYQWDKKIASHLGGSRTSMVISYPKGIKDPVGCGPSSPTSPTSCPTILEAAGLPMPTIDRGYRAGAAQRRQPAAVLQQGRRARAPHDPVLRGDREPGHLSRRLDGQHRAQTAALGGPRPDQPDPFEEYEWQLYHLDDDFTQSKNVAKDNPDKLEELRQLFLERGRRRTRCFRSTTATSSGSSPENRPQHNAGRTVYTYFDPEPPASPRAWRRT